MRVLTIDLGASSVRCMVVDYTSGVLSYEEIYRFENKILTNENKELRWDIYNILSEIKTGVNKAFEKYDDIVSIGVDSWGCDYAYIRKNGEFADNPFCYRDKRTVDASKKALEIISADRLYYLTGIQLMHFNTIFQLYADHLQKRLHTDYSDKFLMIADIVNYFLTGEMSLEITNLSTASLLDVKTLQISGEILYKLSIKESLFPKIYKPGQVIGHLLDSVVPNLKRKVPVVAVCSHDTASAILGMPVDDETIYISSGTWSLLGVESKNFINDSKSKERNFTNELGYGDRFCYLKNVMGMFVYNQLRKEYKDNGETLSHDTIVKLISEAPYLEKFIDVDNPKLSTPFNMSLKLRSILAETNQTPPTFAGQWFSMIYESMACKYRHTIDRLKEATNRDFKRIVVGGGGNQAELLNQYTANVTNMIVEQGAVEATVLGNALAQFISLGAIKSVEEGREIIEKSFSGKKYFPNNVDDWNKKYERFKRAVIKEDKD